MSIKSCGGTEVALCLAVGLILPFLNSCKFFPKPKLVHRIHNLSSNAVPSLILLDSVGLERSLDGTSLALTFETSAAVDCMFSFYPVGEKPAKPLPLTNCTGKSATKFSELISGVPKDRLVTIALKSWASVEKEKTATIINIDESVPAADAVSLNMISVDLGASRLEFSTLNSSDLPSAFVASGQGETGCWLSDEKNPGKPAQKKAAIVQSLSSQGYISAVTARVSPTTFASTFQITQRLSTEWSVSAKTAAGFGKLRLAKPTMLATSEFAGQNKAVGSFDRLEDIDPPGLNLSATSALVTTWTLDGAGKNATATLTIAPSGAFPGISCRSPATALKISVPATLIAKIPANVRLWSTLRIDSWQALEKERWVVRVSDWTSMGVQKI